MITIQFLAEWALRSSALILSGALLLWALRVKDPCIRLAAWTAMLCGSLAIPLLVALAPTMAVPAIRRAPRSLAAPAPVDAVAAGPVSEAPPREASVSKRFDWARAVVASYVLVALALLLRLCVGLAIGLRLLRGSRATGRETCGIPIRESDRVATPVTLGILRPAIVLPADWPQWDDAKLDAVLAHERSHVRRRDPAVQLLSAIHRALLWHSPLSWFLHRRIVRIAEEASDDAAVAVARDRAFYAEVLLEFMQRAARRPNWQGVPMARYGRADQRIHRVLDGTALSRGVTRWSVAAILALGAPLAYLAAAAQPQGAAQVQPPSPTVPAVTEKTVKPAVEKPRQASDAAQSAATPEAGTGYLRALGNVSPYTTVTVKPRVDGQLLSVGFKEGGLVQAGQVLATIDPQPYQLLLVQAEGQLARDQAQLEDAAAQIPRLRQLSASQVIPKDQLDTRMAEVSQLEGALRADRANVDRAKLQLSYTQIASPIAGMAGLRLVDPGNIVHATDSNAIVVINQLQPIAVLFTVPEDSLPQVLAMVRNGATPPVEAWNRDNSAKIATGRLTAVDNQFDQETGTAKLKAVFDNKDGALFPNEFVNVRLFASAK
jgi:RND family efflux transporter MFP subunit